MTVAQAAEAIQVSTSLLYAAIAKGELECYTVGKAGIRLSWRAHIEPYLLREMKRGNPRKPKAQRLSGRKATLKHLDP